MDLIKLLDVSSPKSIKNVINTLITEYINVERNFPTKLSDLTDDETHRLVTDAEKASWSAKLSVIPNDYKTKTENDNLYQPKGNYLTSFTETDPTVPAWAKAATKPSYNYSEINNTPTIPTVNNPTVTIKQGEETKGTFTLNQSNDSIIELDVGGGGSGSNVTLYEGLGQNTDGAMTQKAVTDELQSIYTNYATKNEAIQTIPTQYIRITDLATGVYKLTYSGTKYIYYNGSSSTSTHTVTGSTGQVILIVNRYSTSYWHWYYINGTSSLGTLYAGYTSTSSGSYSSASLSKIVSASTSVDNMVWASGISQTISSTKTFTGGVTFDCTVLVPDVEV